MKPFIVLMLIGAVLLTQRWYGWEEGHGFGGSDAASYEQIARAAPAFPQDQPPFHHAQRLAGPYLVGLGARAIGLDVRTLFEIATGACLLLAIASLGAALSRMDVPGRAFAFCMTLFVMHFSLRFYLAAPGMLPDALFAGGLALTLYGLAGRNLAVVLAGALIAATGRQTALLMLPGVAAWMATGAGWADRSVMRKGCAIAAVTGATLAAYLASARLATAFGLPSENLAHVTGLAEWLRSPAYSVGELGTFLGFATIPLLLALCLIAPLLWRARGRPLSPEVRACFLLSGAIVSQPLLAGPEIAGANALRLAALGLAPLVVAAALLIRQSPCPEDHWKYRAPLLIGVLLAASLHYNYTRVGPQTPALFALLQLALALGAASLVYRKPDRKGVPGGQTASA